MFKGTRLPVATVIENLEDLRVDEVMEQFDVTREQVTAVRNSWPRICAPKSPPVLVLFDHGTPKGLALVQSEHTVHTAQSKGWDRLDNGALLNAAEEAGFEFGAHNRPTDPLPAESESPPLALVVLTGSTRWSVVQQHADRIAVAVRSAAPGSYAEVEIPYESKAQRR